MTHTMRRPEKVLSRQFEKNKGSAGVNVQNNPFAIIYFFFSDFQNPFGLYFKIKSTI